MLSGLPLTEGNNSEPNGPFPSKTYCLSISSSCGHRGTLRWLVTVLRRRHVLGRNVTTFRSKDTSSTSRPRTSDLRPPVSRRVAMMGYRGPMTRAAEGGLYVLADSSRRAASCTSSQRASRRVGVGLSIREATGLKPGSTHPSLWARRYKLDKATRCWRTLWSLSGRFEIGLTNSRSADTHWPISAGPIPVRSRAAPKNSTARSKHSCIRPRCFSVTRPARAFSTRW